MLLVMIALPGTSQITYTVNDTCRVCYTRDENRKLALLIYNDSYNRKLIINYYHQINNYKALVKKYQQDSTLYIKYTDESNNKYDILYTDYTIKVKDNDQLTYKVKRKNNWIIGLLTSSGVLFGTTIYLLTK